MSKSVVIALSVFVTVVSGGVVPEGLANVYRYWNGVDHFYTQNSAEIGSALQVGQVGKYNYKYEGIAFRGYSSQFSGAVPLHRYWNGVEHFYTTNVTEIGTTVLGQVGNFRYKYEGVTAYVYRSCGNGLKPLFRYWNGREHFYTTESHEIGTTTAGEVGKYGYKSEGVACWVH